MKRRERIHKFPVKITDRLRKFNVFKILSIILIVVFILSIPTIIQKLVKVQKITCVSQYGDCPVFLTFLNYEGKDYKAVKSQINTILEQNILINSFLIQYKIPGTLQIEVDLKKPKFAVRGLSTIKDLQNRIFLVDKDGLIVEMANESDLPTLQKNESSEYKVGDTVTDKDKFSLSLFEGVNYLYSIKLGIQEKNELKVTNSEGIIIRFPLEGDKDVLLGSLRLIFSRLNDSSEGIRMEDVNEIDLRFKNPVIR